jgi:hypothetical protein
MRSGGRTEDVGVVERDERRVVWYAHFEVARRRSSLLSKAVQPVLPLCFFDRTCGSSTSMKREKRRETRGMEGASDLASSASAPVYNRRLFSASLV